MTVKSAHPTFVLTGRHVLTILVAFFGTVFAVNAWFLGSAISTYSGIVANEPYRKGLAYNQRISADERQAAMKWSTTLEATRSGDITFSAHGPDGQPITRLFVKGTIGRPSTQSFDHQLTFQEQSPGLYRASTGALHEGSWLIAIEARGDSPTSEILYRMRKRQWLKP